jgi:hypothetical protein
MRLYILLINLTKLLNVNAWMITPAAKYYKYAKESELHHGRIALLIESQLQTQLNLQTHLQLNLHNSINNLHNSINNLHNGLFHFIIIYEIMRLFYLEQPFMMKESHYLGNYLRLNMNNKNVIIKTEIFFSRIAIIYFYFY